MRTITLIQAIQAVLEYLSDDWEEYEQGRAEGINLENHIGIHLMNLQAFLDHLLSALAKRKIDWETRC
jgi:hypothetical protein